MYRDPQKLRLKYRQTFLRYLHEMAPEVMERLRILAIPYKEIFGVQWFNERGRAGSVLLETEEIPGWLLLHELTGQPHFAQIEDPELTVEEKALVGLIRDLRRNLQEFLSDFGFDVPWLRYATLETLQHLAANPRLKGGLFSTEMLTDFINDPPLYRLPEWIPTRTSLREYKKVAKAHFGELLDKYTNEIKDKAESAYESAKGRPHDFQRVKWLVRWTVQQRTVREIHEEFNAEERTIWAALDSLKEFGLPVRRKNAQITES